MSLSYDQFLKDRAKSIETQTNNLLNALENHMDVENNCNNNDDGINNDVYSSSPNTTTSTNSTNSIQLEPENETIFVNEPEDEENTENEITFEDEMIHQVLLLHALYNPSRRFTKQIIQLINFILQELKSPVKIPGLDDILKTFAGNYNVVKFNGKNGKEESLVYFPMKKRFDNMSKKELELIDPENQVYPRSSGSYFFSDSNIYQSLANKKIVPIQMNLDGYGIKKTILGCFLDILKYHFFDPKYLTKKNLLI